MELTEEMARKVTVIPISPEFTQRDIRKQRLRVALYCRVSTASEEQLNSYTAQIEYFKTILCPFVTGKYKNGPRRFQLRVRVDDGKFRVYNAFGNTA